MMAIFNAKKNQSLVRVTVFLITVAIITGMVGCDGGGGNNNPPPSENLEIWDWYDLDDIRDNLAGNHTLMNDLDSTTAGYEELAGPTANLGKGWEPIGIVIPQCECTRGQFTGTFDGRGYEICDLYINRPDESDVGLFGKTADAVIQNIGVMTATVTGDVAVGCLVGGSYGTVSNSYSNGNVTGNVGVGGLVGTNGYGTVSDSYSTGNVTGYEYVGGLVGWHANTMSNSYSSCNVAGNFSVGGLVGYSYYGTVSNSYSAGNVNGYEDVGGLVGRNEGLSGDTTEGIVSDSFATGNVIGDRNVGGLVGYNDFCVIQTSYSIGSVTGNVRIGGLLGKNFWGSVYNSYWDIETSGLNTSAGIGARGATTIEMKDVTTFSGPDWSGTTWDITTVDNPDTRNSSYVWNIVNNVTYPFLSWQP